MTAVAPPPPARSGTAGATPDARSGIARCLDRLTDAIAAASTLGVPTDAARAVAAEAESRLGLTAEVYAVALVGGTGVGKSSLLNALAGSEVSPASPRRPTTARPLAWVPRSRLEIAAPLLERLSVDAIVDHDVEALDGIAILDVPDLDSVSAEHRATVEAILPRLDAVIWVTDPEKYHDAVLHDDFLAAWLPRLSHQLLVVNKGDRLPPNDVERIRRDLDRGLVRLVPAAARPRVVVTSARTADGTSPLRDWLEQGVEAKRIVLARLATSVSTALVDLATKAGFDPDLAAGQILPPDARRKAIDAATSEILRVVDLDGVEAQAVAATRARARSKGAGPIGRFTSLVYRLSGRQARAADPIGYLRRWRDRGSTAQAVRALSAATDEPLRSAAPAVRPALAEATTAPTLEATLGAVVDRAVAAHGEWRAPTSRLWSILGLLQTLDLALLAIGVAWLVVWLIARPTVSSIVVPLVGDVPSPFAVVVVTAVLGFVLGWLLGAHAGWLGRRWAAQLRNELRTGIGRAVDRDAYARLDRLEAARRALWVAARSRTDCAGR